MLDSLKGKRHKTGKFYRETHDFSILLALVKLTRLVHRNSKIVLLNEVLMVAGLEVVVPCPVSPPCG